MKLRIGILSILVLITLSLSAQDVEKCNTKILLSTSKRVGKLTQREISDFLMTFGKECRVNVEYSEWSNEILFDILDKQTEQMLKAIEKGEKWFEMSVILEDLESPLLDAPIKDLIERMDKIYINPRLKNQIIDKLKIADAGNN